MAIKSPKQKGSTGEYEVISLLNGWLAKEGLTAQLERNLEQVRHGGADINGWHGLEIEVKRVEVPAIKQWWGQVCRASAKSGKIPTLAHRRNRQPWRFRVASFGAIYNGAAGITVPLIMDLELDQAELWFRTHATHHREHFNAALPQSPPPSPPPAPE